MFTLCILKNYNIRKNCYRCRVVAGGPGNVIKLTLAIRRLYDFLSHKEHLNGVDYKVFDHLSPGDMMFDHLD